MLKNIFKLSNINEKIKTTFFEFPLIVLFIFSSVLLSFLEVHKVDLFGSMQEDIVFTLILSIIPLISIKLFAKSFGLASLKECALNVLMVMYMAYNVIHFDVESAFLVGLIFLTITFSPYLFRKNTNKDFIFYNYDLIYSSLFAFLASLILFLGLSAIFASVGYLFEIKIHHRVYTDISIASFLGLMPLLFLSNLSKQFDFSNEEFRVVKAFEILIKNILLPLLLVYMVILYLYFFKILIEQSLPKGNLASMIIAFGSIGVLTKILIYTIKDNSSRLVKFFDKYFFYTMLIPIGMLCVSFFRRVSDYGITEARYAIGVFIVWFIVICIISFIKKENFNFKYIVISLAALCVIALLGPISATNISAKSQLDRFNSILERNSILVGGKIFPATKDLSLDDRIDLTSIASYLARNKVAKEKLIELYPELENKVVRSNIPILKFINVKHAHKSLRRLGENRVSGFRFSYYGGVVKTKGYDYVVKYQGYNQNRNGDVEIFIRTGKLIVVFKNEDRVEFDLNSLVDKLKGKRVFELNKQTVDEFTMKSLSQGQKYKVKIQVISLYSNSKDVNSFTGYVMFKRN